jgi:hypothetical protein
MGLDRIRGDIYSEKNVSRDKHSQAEKNRTTFCQRGIRALRVATHEEEMFPQRVMRDVG